jgi:glycosyltransferase involved in cell wall biosynthesis
MSDLVSILIPAYNAERWLADAVKSALGQTWRSIEIIIVDDGSRDRTLQIARSFESRLVKVVTQPNAGAAVARNTAFTFAQGSFIQWLDADDLLDARKIEKQMVVARDCADPWVALSCPFGTFYHRIEKAMFVRTSLWRDLTPLEYFLIRFNENVHFQTDAWLVSRELTEAAGPWSDQSPDDDGEYFCRVAAHSRGIKFVEGARTYYRSGISGSLHVKRSNKALAALFTSKVKCIRYLLSLEESARTRQASIQLLQDWLPCFYPEYPDIVEQARKLARELGGDLRIPRLNWKYRPLEYVFGLESAATFSRLVPTLKSRLFAEWDRSVLLVRRQ